MARLGKRAVLAAAAAAAFACGAATARVGDEAAHSWSSYANARFRYSLCYPDDVLVPQPEAQNGDGRVFRAADGTELLAYGSYNALGHSLRAAFEATAADLAGGSGRVTYSVVKSDWFVVSGEKNGKVFYAKTLYNPGEDAFKTIEITYPAASKPLYDPIVGKVVGCFRDEAR